MQTAIILIVAAGVAVVPAVALFQFGRWFERWRVRIDLVRRLERD